MSFTVYFHPLAEKEVADSYYWYETKLEGLGERFLQEVEKKLTDILKQPDKYPKKKGIFREAMIRVFPYLIVYKALNKRKEIHIASVFHTSRNPKLKYRK